MIESESETQLDRIEKILDRVSKILDKLEPHLPMLEKLAANPAARFMSGFGKK